MNDLTKSNVSRKSKGVQLIEKWIHDCSSIVPGTRYNTCYELLKMSTPMNTSILNYETAYKKCLVCNDNDKAIIDCGGLIIDYFFYYNRKDYDIIIRCMPVINDNIINNLVMSKKKRFMSNVSNNIADATIFMIFYGFNKSNTVSKSPSMTVTDSAARGKDDDVDLFSKTLLQIFKKRLR